MNPTSSSARLGGHALVEALVAQGVSTVFGVPGESYLAVLDGIHQHRERIRFIACRNEGGASFMAEAAGKLTGRPGVCMVTRGPGATNASIGLHTAFQDSTPMVMFIGQVARDMRDREGFQELDYRAVFGPNSGGFAKWVAEVDDPARLPEYVARAFHVAMQGRPGPVVIALPEDMLTQPTRALVLPRVEPAHAAPEPYALARAAELLRQAERPLVLLGGSGWMRDDTGREAAGALQRFAEKWQLPVACAFRFQDLFDNTHPQYAGDVGIAPNPLLAQRVKDADIILAVGPRLGEMTTSGYTLLEAPRPKQKLIHIHAGAEELGRVYAADVLIQASMAVAALALEALEAPASVPWAEWTAQAARDYATHRTPSTDPALTDPMDMAAVIQTIERLAPRDAVLTNGAGNFAGWLHRFYRYGGLAAQGRCQLAPTSGAMGYGVPAGIAASILQPGRVVVTIAGDGDFLMNGQELATAAAYGARPIVVVVDNGTFGTIRMHQEREYPGRVSGTDLHNPDFVLLAQAFGWKSERIERTAEFEPAFARALDATQPTLLHIRLSPDVSNSKLTLSAIRDAAAKRLGQG
jgi:acetolactate synthase-1/2/3 large subunit